MAISYVGASENIEYMGSQRKKKVINDHTSAVVTKYYLEKIET